MIMIIGTALCVCSERKKNMGLHCLLNLAVSQVIGVGMGVDVALLIHATGRALEPQFWAERPSVACTAACHTRKWIVLLDHSAPFSASQVPRANRRFISFSKSEDALMLSDGVSLGSLPCSY